MSLSTRGSFSRATRRLAGALPLALALMVLATPPAAARERSARSSALHLARAGAKDYAAGRFPEALEKFEKAYALFPNPPLVLNLSRTYLKLGQCDEAIRYAQIYGTDSTGAAVKSRGSWLQRVQNKCVDVEITSTPAGASLWIKGVASASPTVTPWHGKLLAGPYPIVAKATGFAEHDETLQVEEQQPLHVALKLNPTTFAEPLPPPPEEPIVAAPAPKTSPAPAVAASPTPKAAKPHAIDLALKTAPHRAAPAAATRPAMRPLKAVGWAAVAVGGAALVAAIALGVAANNDANTLATPSLTRTGAGAEKLKRSNNTYATSANALFGVGGAIAAGGVALVIVF